MSNAREKMGEATYFLDRMKETAADADAFKYNLSAFLSAARSVWNHLRAEHARTPGFKTWAEKKWQDFDADARMKFFIDKRREAVHIRPVSPAAQVKVEVHEVLHMTDAVIVQKMDKEGKVIEERRSVSPPASPPAEPRLPRIEWRWHFDELPDIDVVTASEEQLRKLRHVLDECEDQFGEPS